MSCRPRASAFRSSRPAEAPPTGSPYRWRHRSTPSASCARSSPRGLPIIALLPSDPDPALTAEVTSGGRTATSTSGLCIVDEHTYRTTDDVYGPTGASILAGDDAVLLIADQPLSDGPVSVAIHRPGQPDVAWSFTASVPVPAPVVVPGKTSSGSSTALRKATTTLTKTKARSAAKHYVRGHLRGRHVSLTCKRLAPAKMGCRAHYTRTFHGRARRRTVRLVVARGSRSVVVTRRRT